MFKIGQLCTMLRDESGRHAGDRVYVVANQYQGYGRIVVASNDAPISRSVVDLNNLKARPGRPKKIL